MIECGAGQGISPALASFFNSTKARVAGHARLGEKNAIGIG